MNVIESDASKVWVALTKSYPKGYFDGVIEDTYGTILDPDKEEELYRTVERVQVDSEKEIKKITERLSI